MYRDENRTSCSRGDVEDEQRRSLSVPFSPGHCFCSQKMPASLWPDRAGGDAFEAEFVPKDVIFATIFVISKRRNFYYKAKRNFLRCALRAAKNEKVFFFSPLVCCVLISIYKSASAEQHDFLPFPGKRECFKKCILSLSETASAPVCIRGITFGDKAKDVSSHYGAQWALNMWCRSSVFAAAWNRNRVNWNPISSHKICFLQQQQQHNRRRSGNT